MHEAVDELKFEIYSAAGLSHARDSLSWYFRTGMRGTEERTGNGQSTLKYLMMLLDRLNIFYFYLESSNEHPMDRTTLDASNAFFLQLLYDSS